MKAESLGHKAEGRGPDVVALVLATGLAVLVGLIAVAAMIEVIVGHKGIDVAISANATQLLDTSVSGLVAVLGGYMGFRYGRSAATAGLLSQPSAKSAEQTGTTASAQSVVAPATPSDTPLGTASDASE
jgi:hypothetical protein